MGSITGHRIDYKRVLIWQANNIPSKTWPKYPTPSSHPASLDLPSSWAAKAELGTRKCLRRSKIFKLCRKTTNDFCNSLHEYRKLCNERRRRQFPGHPQAELETAENCWKLQNESSEDLDCCCLIESWGLCRSLIYSVVVSLRSILLLPRCCHSRGRKKSDEILLTMEAYCHTFWPNR